jgi:HSP20 family protein
MAFGAIRPFRKNGRELGNQWQGPVSSLSREMNKLFNDFFTDFDVNPLGTLARSSDFVPRLDLEEKDNEYVVTAELPGMDQKDIELSIEDDTLILKGEKKNESEDKGKNYYRMERSYGSFQRAIALGEEIDTDNVKAGFSKGVLTINLPKTGKAKESRKRIEVKSE